LRLKDWFVPVLYQEARDPQLIREVPAERVQEVFARQRELALGDIPAEPEHGFVGRSRELLKAERLLAMERYVVLQGGGGEGKTTLGAELARWLVFTRRFARGAFVRLDEDGDARKVLFAIGGQLVPNYHSRAAVDADVARQLVEYTLREEATVIVLDNMESVLAPAPGSEASLAFEPETLPGILELCRSLGKIGETRLIFTSREALPAPFAGNVQRIGRLDRVDAIRLVGRVLGEGKWMPHSVDEAGSEEEVGELVDAVGCHARAVTLLTGEVAASGVGRANEKIHEMMASLEKKHPGERERSLLASVELSLRRLPVETRRKMRPLGVFQGGGYVGVMAMVLSLDVETDEEIVFARELVGVGLAEQLGFGYLRLDPALAPALLAEMTRDEREAARAGWADAMASLMNFLYEQFFKDINLAVNLALLESANLLSALEYLRLKAAPERVALLAGRVERFVAALGRPRVLARVTEIRAEAAQKLSAWSHVSFEAESSAAERLLEQARYYEAERAARSILERAQAAGEESYDGAAYDLAFVHVLVGRTLKFSGSAEEAITNHDEGRRRFDALGKTRMANVALSGKADCLTSLGRYEEAATAYEEASGRAEELHDIRHTAVTQFQLATVRMFQERYSEALEVFEKTRKIFEKLGEPSSVAIAWHQIGSVHQKAGQYEAAESAYQDSLKIKVQMSDGPAEAMTLGQLGTLYAQMGRREDAVRLFRQAAELFAQVSDFKNEGTTHGNIANELVKLNRYDEARVELLRGIQCNEPFGHMAEPWKTFGILSDLERATGNEPEARKARGQAVQAYLAYRRDGGASQTPLGVIFALAAHDTESAKGQLAALRPEANLPDFANASIAGLEAVLAGSRDPALANNPELHYMDAAELLLLMEKLS
jgi:tetratricopeptide (TPR) repeat protein